MLYKNAHVNNNTHIQRWEMMLEVYEVLATIDWLMIADDDIEKEF